MRETKNLEFKENITNTFLKTVSAFANYGTGKIIFGVNDAGETIGLEDLNTLCLNIENKINDSISPNPSYTLEPDPSNGTITLTVEEGIHKPYYYKSKAYKRNDSATVEVDRLELGRLILVGQNTTYDAVEARTQNLTFNKLEEKAKSALGVKALTDDALKTLELEDASGRFNIAAELLADTNSFPGIDIARFGDSINIFLDRETIDKQSVLTQFDDATLFFKRYYEFEEIDGTQRVLRERIPEAAFREAVANALVHRQWDTAAYVRISMFEDKIEITSPGGLPPELSEKEYLEGQISILRNPILGNVFFRLGLIERFGTGVLRIRECYKHSVVKPEFKVFENSICVTLPVLQSTANLSEDALRVYRILKGRTLPSSEISEQSGFSKSKTNKIIKALVAEGYVSVRGNGRGTKYTA